jgi:HEAT repeat protein
VCQKALLALEQVRLDAGVLPALKQAARRDDPFTCEKAIELRWRIDRDTKVAVASLVEMLKKSSAWRVSAARALARMGPDAKDAALALAGVLDDQHDVTRFEAVQALRSIGRDARAALPAVVAARVDRNLDVRLKLAVAIQRLGGEARDCLPVLLEAVKDEKPQRRDVGHDTLRRFGPAARDATPVLLGLLRGSDPRGRLEAAVTLVRVNPSQSDTAFDTLLDLLPTPVNGTVRLDAAYWLWELDRHNPRALAFLINTLSDLSAGMRNNASIIFLRMGAEGKLGLPHLLGMLEDDADDVRVHAAAAIRRIDPGNARARIALTALLKDRAVLPELRERASLHLGGEGPAGKDAVPLLLESLKSPIRAIRVSAAAALKKIDSEAATKAGLP